MSQEAAGRVETDDSSAPASDENGDADERGHEQHNLDVYQASQVQRPTDALASNSRAPVVQSNQSSVPRLESTQSLSLSPLTPSNRSGFHTTSANTSGINSKNNNYDNNSNNNRNYNRQLHPKSTRQVPGGAGASVAGQAAAAASASTEMTAPHAAAAAAAYALAQAGKKAADKLNADLCKNFSIGIQHDNGGIFTSPNYPNPYPTSLVCTKLIEGKWRISSLFVQLACLLAFGF